MDRIRIEFIVLVFVLLLVWCFSLFLSLPKWTSAKHTRLDSYLACHFQSLNDVASFYLSLSLSVHCVLSFVFTDFIESVRVFVVNLSTLNGGGLCIVLPAAWKYRKYDWSVPLVNVYRIINWDGYVLCGKHVSNTQQDAPDGLHAKTEERGYGVWIAFRR